MTTTETITARSICNPINGNKLYEISDAGEEQIRNCYAKARKVQPLVRKLTVDERVEEILKINDYVIENREKILTRIIEETGKSRFDALSSEVFEICDVIDYFKKAAPKILSDKKVHTPIVLMGKKSKIFFEPLGTVLVITPWNYPLYQVLVPSLLAFLAGNSVIVKPSEVTPLKGLAEEILEKSGFIKDAIQLVYGGKETGKMLIENRPDKIHFTGSVESGKKIMEQAAKYLVPVDLELGGKDAALVFDDVNMERTVNGIMWGAFTNCGQSCTSIERVYVHHKIYEEFVKLLAEKISKLKYSSEKRNYQSPEDCDVGSMTTEFQAGKIEEHILEAVTNGAKVLAGGKRENGKMHFPPTLLTEVSHQMKIMTEETFGPVLPVMKFKTEDEAISLANDSVYGLSASVWSKDLKRAERVARKLEVGNVSINSHMLTEANPALPFGGVKQSGFGRMKGEYGLLAFCNIKSVIMDVQGKKIEPHWYPQTGTKYNMLSDLMVALFSRSKNWIKFALIGLKLDSIGTKEKIS